MGTRLVGLRADSPASLARLRALFARWIDDTHPDVPWAFDVRLDAPSDTRGPVPVPQLRIGQSLLARSRSADDVLVATASVLGGVLAVQDDDQSDGPGDDHDDGSPDTDSGEPGGERLWLGLRVFVRGDDAVLFDGRSSALSGDRTLARAGVTMLPTWSIAVTGGAKPTVEIPPMLDGLDWPAVGIDATASAGRRHRLAGIVGLDTTPDATGDESPAERLARYSARHTSGDWFTIVAELLDDARVVTTTDRPAARRAIIDLIDRH